MKTPAWLALLAPLVLLGCEPDYLDLGEDDQPITTGSTTTSTTLALCTPGEKRECYTGPEGTEGQGICKAGEETCNAEGTAFGPCEKEQLPKPEDCATPEDDDCDGQTPDCGGGLLWARRFGDAQIQEARAIATDPSGAVVVTGFVSGEVDFGGGPSDSTGQIDIFVVKLAADGSTVWSSHYGDPNVPIGNPSLQSGAGIATDSAGNVLVTGSLSGMVDFGGGVIGSNAIASDIFVVKLAPDGSHVWSKGFGDSSAQNGASIAADAAGNVLVTGSFSGAASFGGDTFTSAGASDLFVVKLAPDGSHLWSKSFGDSNAQNGASIAADAAGNVLVTGSFSGGASFGGETFTSAGASDIFVVKLAPDGSHLWSKSFGDSSSQSGASVVADAAGNVLVTGSFSGALSFGGETLQSKGTSDGFVVKLAADGSHLWSKAFGDGNKEGATAGAAGAVDTRGNVLLTGSFSGAVNFGGGPLGGVGSDLFTVKLAPDGLHRWSYRYGDEQSQTGRGIATDSSGNVFVTGSFTGIVDFGGTILSSAGNSDIFIAAYAP